MRTVSGPLQESRKSPGSPTRQQCLVANSNSIGHKGSHSSDADRLVLGSGEEWAPAERGGGGSAVDEGGPGIGVIAARVGDQHAEASRAASTLGAVAAMPARAQKCPVVPGERNGQRPVDAAAMSRTSTNALYSRTAPSPTPAACATDPGPGRTVLHPRPPPGAGTP